MAEQNSSKSIMWKTIGVAAILIAIIYPLTNRTYHSAADAAKGTDESDVRIQPVAKFELTKADAATSSGPKDGATIFNTVCGACHNTGAAGAPKVDDKAAWAPRVATGKEALYKSALNGKNAMPARGGTSLSDAEIKATVDYILTKVK
uniref:Cytochrome c, class I n=1 Tax=Dechloromonas aromatica (strain RCB) TaxID=159087 RepID=Q478X6_DECAR